MTGESSVCHVNRKSIRWAIFGRNKTHYIQWLKVYLWKSILHFRYIKIQQSQNINLKRPPISIYRFIKIMHVSSSTILNSAQCASSSIAEVRYHLLKVITFISVSTSPFRLPLHFLLVCRSRYHLFFSSFQKFYKRGDIKIPFPHKPIILFEKCVFFRQVKLWIWNLLYMDTSVDTCALF